MVWTPGNLPPHPRAAPRATARQEQSTAKHCASQLPPRAPTDCHSGGARSQEEGRQLPVTTLANCQSGEAKVPFWELGTAWPAVIPKGPGASVGKSTTGHSGDSGFATQIPFLLLLARAPHWTCGEPPSHNPQALCFRGLQVLRWVTKTQHRARIGQPEYPISPVL